MVINNNKKKNPEDNSSHDTMFTSICHETHQIIFTYCLIAHNNFEGELLLSLFSNEIIEGQLNFRDGEKKVDL